MTRPHLERIAPARDADIGIAANDHGADAVHIGGPGFGERDKASNTVPEVERLVRHAHRFHARIFVTLNTILRDDELEPACRLAWQLYEAGADAPIGEDTLLLELDRPPIQLQASTLNDIRTLAKARFLQHLGFSQRVLAVPLHHAPGAVGRAHPGQRGSAGGIVALDVARDASARAHPCGCVALVLRSHPNCSTFALLSCNSPRAAQAGHCAANRHAARLRRLRT